jgi:DNA-directed RNA polymerase specialized sigma24 family protein
MDGGASILRELQGRARRQRLGDWTLPLASRRGIVSQALEGLPEGLRLLLALRYCEGLGVRELADALQLPPREVQRAMSAAVSEIYRSLLQAERGARTEGTG